MRNAIAGGVSRTDGDFAVLVSVDLRHDLRVRPIAIVDHANQSVALRLRNRGWWGDLQQAGTSNHRHKRHRRAAHRHTTTPAPPDGKADVTAASSALRALRTRSSFPM